MSKCRLDSYLAFFGEMFLRRQKLLGSSSISALVRSRQYGHELKCTFCVLYLLSCSHWSSALRLLLINIKRRTFSKTNEELWFEEWRNDLAEGVEVGDPGTFMNKLQISGEVLEEFVQIWLLLGIYWFSLISDHYFDKIQTGFLTWSQTIKGYKPVTDRSTFFKWDTRSQPALDELESSLFHPNIFKQIVLLWSQETVRSSGSFEVRDENISLIKTSG